MKPKVAILGGGVAGMSAAHELAERGFAVEVYERQPVYVGGKARSVDVDGTSINGSKPLPGEHGFRFFPGFYKHITDTMKRIPFAGNPNGVFDNLVSTERVLLARFGKAPILNLVSFPKNMADLRTAINAMTHADMGLTASDKERFVNKLWQLLTSSYTRRQQEYERISWWQFMETEQQSKAYEEYCVGGLTHTLVAAQPKLMSTKTGGDILLQLILLMFNPAASTDRILNGPTNEVWLFPWLQHLKYMGVEYYHGYHATEFQCNRNTRIITGATVINAVNGEKKEVKADYYIAAVPLERMIQLISDDMLAVDNSLDFLWHLAETSHSVDKHQNGETPKPVKSLNWMNGIQYYLNQDVPIDKGHVIFIDSPWAVTGISQAQFWPNFDLSQCYDGSVKGVLSVDVSDWFTKGFNGKAAHECSLEEIKDEVWVQMERSLIVDGRKLLDRSMIVWVNVDQDITVKQKQEKAQNAAGHVLITSPADPDTDDGTPKALDNHFFSDHNDEPLLVNVANTWSKRPEAATNILNFFLASDYVRTNTDLATMEGANEAARRAVNGIIARSGVNAPYCQIWKLHEPDLLAPLRWLDKQRYEKGLPWTNEVPWLFKVAQDIGHLVYKVKGNVPTS
ncbi:FAD-dependent oxidoreductase [Nibrella saemangeumensis]|uniref:FAD-dependent oxidoreductase n=1 Tax=Nibrella saemangeumensis TaxID=1084526 RepID=A0ABP8NHB1_9BACT